MINILYIYMTIKNNLNKIDNDLSKIFEYYSCIKLLQLLQSYKDIKNDTQSSVKMYFFTHLGEKKSLFGIFLCV